MQKHAAAKSSTNASSLTENHVVRKCALFAGTWLNHFFSLSSKRCFMISRAIICTIVQLSNKKTGTYVQL